MEGPLTLVFVLVLGAPNVAFRQGSAGAEIIVPLSEIPEPSKVLALWIEAQNSWV